MSLDKVTAHASIGGQSALEINRCPRHQFAKICSLNSFGEQVKGEYTVAKDGYGETTTVYRNAFTYFYVASNCRRANGDLSRATGRCYRDNFAAFFDQTGEHRMETEETLQSDALVFIARREVT